MPMEVLHMLFKALADPTRVRIVMLLARPDALCCSAADQVCACDLERLLGLAQPTISHHMRTLVQAGLVEARKSGRWVYYRLNRNRFSAVARHLAELVGDTGDSPGLLPPVIHPLDTDGDRHRQL
ncbi:MAG: winged helix-turn-helix transcriptional regulator [Betaproteobacteria bacterium]|nr:winged helix-turn-helix transcriptional regulator [Betaproteobacteria bacterium]MBI3055377.1 winged helix-turn-helix transcriptional regulator [Betaproteobacteria bacterium]